MPRPSNAAARSPAAEAAIAPDGSLSLDGSLALDGSLSLNDLDSASGFERVVARYQSVVFAICLRLLGHRQDAEDMTQETFQRFYRYRSRWDPNRPIEPYLKTIAGNRCRTLMAKKGRRHQSLAAAAELATTEDEQQTAARWLSEELQQALADLPANHRRAFELFHLHSMAYAEIAETLGCPLGSVKTWVHRARTRLIETLCEREVIHTRSGRAAS